MPSRSRYPFPRSLLTLIASGLAPFAFAQSPLPQTSPFLPAPGTTVIVTQPETLEFAGVSVVSKQTLISLYDTKEKRGRWIPVGGKSEGIEVVSYDGAHDQVVVRQAGQLKTLVLRKPSKMSATVAPMMAGNQATPAMVPTPVASTTSNQPKKPLTQAQQEEEARMFVADMLDIGMQNRKAYEEAQKKAAAEKAAGKSGASTPPTPAGG